MKSNSLFIAFIFISTLTLSQGGVAINNTGINPNPNAMLDVSSDTKGVLITRITTIARTTLGTALGLPDNGMMVYDKNLLAFFYWDGTQWVQVGSGTGDNWGAQVVQTSGTNLSGNGTTGSPLIMTEVDGSITNEIELPTGGTTGQVLSTDGTGNYTWVTDNAGTDVQNIQNLAFNNTTNILTVGIQNGTSQTIDLTSLLNDADSNPANEIQDLAINTTTNILTITNNGTPTSIDLTPYLDNTDAQNIAGSSFNATTGDLVIGIQNGTSQTLNFNGLKDHDWYKVGTTTAPSNINDDIFTQGKVGIGSIAPTFKLNVAGGSELIQNSTVNNNGLIAFDADGNPTPSVTDYASISGLSGGLSLSGLSDASVNSHIYITNGGSVGINTTTPGEMFTIGNNNFVFHNGGDKVIGFNTDWTLANQWTKIAGSNYQGRIHFNPTSGDIGIITSPVVTNLANLTDNRIFIKGTTGNVGIGTTAPTQKLEVAGQVKITGGAPGVGKVLTSDATGVASWQQAIPAGFVGSFNLSTCPTGWVAADGTAGTPDLRGEFVRGLDNGRGVDAGRTLSSWQKGSLSSAGNNNGGIRYQSFYQNQVSPSLTNFGFDTFNSSNYPNVLRNDGPVGNVNLPASSLSTAGIGTTRPRNVALLYCIKQ